MTKLLLTITAAFYLSLCLPGRSFTTSAQEDSADRGEAFLQADNALSVAPSVGILADKIIACESSGDPQAVGDGGKAYGLAQFHRPTFDWLSKLSGKTGDYYNAKDQRDLLIWALENDRGYLWTCFRILESQKT